MRKLLCLTLFFLTSLVCFSQEYGPFKFLDIPIDGDKEQMIEALKDKGFEKKSYDDFLTGVFNGENVRIEIGTNHGIVDLIRVNYPYCSEENDTRVKYNVLLSRFNRNVKYVCLNPRAEVPSNEIIYSNIFENSKYYDVVYFFLNPDINSQEWVEEFKQEYEVYYNKPMERISYEEMEESLFCLPEKVSAAVIGIVWFTMVDSHVIIINYVNFKNRPRGEDL